MRNEKSEKKNEEKNCIQNDVTSLYGFVYLIEKLIYGLRSNASKQMKITLVFHFILCSSSQK